MEETNYTDEKKKDGLDFLLEYSVKHRATDLHIGVGSVPLVRIGSVLETAPETEMVMPQTINEHVKALVDDRKMETLTSTG